MTRYLGPLRRPGETLDDYLRRRKAEAAALHQRPARARLTLGEIEMLARQAGVHVWPASFLLRTVAQLKQRRGYDATAFVDITLNTAIQLLEQARGRPYLPGLLDDGGAA